MGSPAIDDRQEGFDERRKGAEEPTQPISPPAVKSERYNGLDALRAFALLLGLLLHASIRFLLPPGVWAVGVTVPNEFLGWLFYYLHSFRLEVFFLLAGFFGMLVIERRGMLAFTRDRAIRIFLVFAVFLYPMKLALTVLWIEGGKVTGWLGSTQRTTWDLTQEAFSKEVWPDINLTHLWFLYYLACVAALFLLLQLMPGKSEVLGWLDGPMHRVISSYWAPVWLAVVVTPFLANMADLHIVTPDKSFALEWAVLLLYLTFFGLGVWLYRHTHLFSRIAPRWRSYLASGLVLSVAGSIGIAQRFVNPPWVQANHNLALWGSCFVTSLTMTFSVFGWLGCFLTLFPKPSTRVRYVADASYWIYIGHLPVVLALQVGLAKFRMPWWWEIPAVAASTFVCLLIVYHFAIRDSWVGTWLRGRRLDVASPAATMAAKAASAG